MTDCNEKTQPVRAEPIKSNWRARVNSKIDSSNILYSDGKNDEMYTPAYGVMPIIEFLPKDKIIWCPFDSRDSQFVKLLQGNGYNVTYSHIDDGKDFFEYEPDEWGVLVSNPPFTGKRQIFERALSFGKPFALLMSNTWLNDSAPKQLFYDVDLQLLMFDKRIEYSGDKKITFSSSYYCRDVLPKQIVMRKIEKKLKALEEV